MCENLLVVYNFNGGADYSVIKNIFIKKWDKVG